MHSCNTMIPGWAVPCHVLSIRLCVLGSCWFSCKTEPTWKTKYWALNFLRRKWHVHAWDRIQGLVTVPRGGFSSCQIHPAWVKPLTAYCNSSRVLMLFPCAKGSLLSCAHPSWHHFPPSHSGWAHLFPQGALIIFPAAALAVHRSYGAFHTCERNIILSLQGWSILYLVGLNNDSSLSFISGFKSTLELQSLLEPIRRTVP